MASKEESSSVEEGPVDMRTKIKRADDILSQIEQSFKSDSDTVKKYASDAAAAIKKLKEAINRQRAEIVAELVQSGELLEASAKLHENYELQLVGDLEEILKISMCGEDVDALENSINFVDHIDNSLKAAVCAAIYDEMSYKNLLDEVEILLLRSKVNALSEEAGLEETKKKIEEDVEKLVERFVDEAKKGKADLSLKAIAVCTAEVFNPLIQIIVEKFINSSGDEVGLLVEYSSEFSADSTQAQLIYHTFIQLKNRDSLERAPVMHLWALALNFLASGANQSLKQLVKGACNEMSQFKRSYYQLLNLLFVSSSAGSPKGCLSKFIGNNKTFYLLINDFVSWYYKASLSNALILISEALNVTSYKNSGTLLLSTYMEMEKADHLVSFEAFKLYRRVKWLTSCSNYTASKYTAEIELLRKNMPKSVTELLWSDNRKCRIINKYYSEPLFASGEDNRVHCWVPCNTKEDQTWSVTINDESSLLYFEHQAKHLGEESVNNQTVAHIGEKTGWMIKTVDDNFVKIFLSEDKYLTAAPKLSSSEGNTRSVQLRTENNTNMQLWQVEFVKNNE